MNLDELRAGIDAIDSQMIELLNRRCEIAARIGSWKHENQMPIYAPQREKEVYEKVVALNQGPLPEASLRAIYREIMSAAIRLERPLTIAFLGPAGTFSHQAVIEKFGRSAEPLPAPTIGDVFRAVESGRADYGVVPVENSTEGVVNPTLDALVGSPVRVTAEFNLPVHQQLYSASSLSEIRCVYSHAQVLGQCREYLQSHLRGATQIEVTSTIRAIELAEREPEAAAIAGVMAGEHTELPVVAENIEDNSRNITRFLVIGRQENPATGDDKTSLCFALHDRAGALYDALRPFRNHNISMTMIESRPLKGGQWEYCFFADIVGHTQDPAVFAACEELRADCALFKIFGSYPRARE